MLSKVKNIEKVGEVMQEVIKRIYEYSLEEILGERFGEYSKEIIQYRALPDVRDGLKPVQRRILYAMYRDHNTYDKPYKKSAKAVGNIMGAYHPHGDSSIYDAMVRMSQWWKQNACYIDMHGNNGSMDGDSPAAMRYTEARLSKISNELLTDIDKDTVEWVPNYDDTLLEPTVLPVKFPLLLVNGAMGISAGYATNIPTHNLGEVIDATIKRIDSPNCRLDTIMEIVKGPDFPTGGIVEGIKGIREAYETGRGKIIIRSKIHFEKQKGKEQIIIDEIPFEVNKANMVRRIDEIRIDKKIEGIQEVRDETSREGLRIAIDLKKDANRELVLNYLLKNTDMQVSYTFNMVAIINHRPMTVGILPILDAYIAHEKEVITRRTNFELRVARKRMHILEGLIRALSILDEVIKIIRASKNKSDAKLNLVKQFEFTEEQAEAIVTLQLYRLTNTDVTELETELKHLQEEVARLEEIISNEDKLKSVMKEELRAVKKGYATPRLTEIKEEITEIKIDTSVMIPKEDVIVAVTHDGYVKRVSLRSYQASNEEPAVKEGDFITHILKLNTLDTILMFTNYGNYLYVPVHIIPDLKWKDLGKHISNVIKLKEGERVIDLVPVTDFESDMIITQATKLGMIKRTNVKDFKVQRYTKPMTSMKLKENDELIFVSSSNYQDIFVTTYRGYGLWYQVDEIPLTGPKGSGVKSINLKDDYVVGTSLFDGKSEYLTVLTKKNTAKRVKLTEFDKMSRARRGIQIIRDVKTNPYYILTTFVLPSKEEIYFHTKDEVIAKKLTEFKVADRYSTGSTFKEKVLHVFCKDVQLESKKEEVVPVEVKEKKISLKEIDERILTIDDFLNDFENKKV